MERFGRDDFDLESKSHSVSNELRELSKELIEKLGHGVTEIRVLGMYSHMEKYMLVCIIRKKQMGKMII